MKLDNMTLMKEFYDREKEKYPTLSFEQFKEICFGPWRFVKHEMESGKLPSIRLKYFGTFQVYPGRAKSMLKTINDRFKYNKISSKQYFHLKEMLENYLKDENK